MPKSLEQFVGNRAPATRCRVCNSPDEVRLQIEANEIAPSNARLSRVLVAAWAKQEYDQQITPDSMYRHTLHHVSA